MKKPFFIFFGLFLILSVNGQDYNLSNGIILNDQNRKGGITAVFNDSADFKSLWDNGTVIRYSNNENNSTNLGKFVEIEYELGFVFEGSFISQGNMRIIFSNLLEIAITEKTIISKGTLIGKTKKGPGNDLRVFILSTEDLPILETWTNDKKIKIGDIWYWDPSFLFR